MTAKNEETPNVEAMNDEERLLIQSCSLVFSQKMTPNNNKVSEDELKKAHDNINKFGTKKLSTQAQKFLIDELVNQIMIAFPPPKNLIDALPKLEAFIAEFKENNPELEFLCKKKISPSK